MLAHKIEVALLVYCMRTEVLGRKTVNARWAIKGDETSDLEISSDRGLSRVGAYGSLLGSLLNP